MLHIEDGRIVKVAGDPDHPVTRGVICERGRLMPDHVHHPQRLNHPLKPKGEKGGGQWQRLTWDQALDEVAEKLSKLKTRYGAETLAFTHGTKRTYHWDCRRFFNLFGSPNTCGCEQRLHVSQLRHGVRHLRRHGRTRGYRGGLHCPLGSNPVNSNPVGLYPQLVHAKKQGTPLIVVEPRRTKEAEMADLWLQIRPGTDVALMLGWIRLIIEEDLYDHDFVENWTVGFEELKAAAEAYTPEKVSEITGIPAALIRKSVRMYATTKPAVLPWGYGLDKQGINATQCARARASLRAITGKPYPVTADISLASNPLLSFPNTGQVFDALKSLQLYVVMDYYLTPSAAFADYVFPASSTVEQPELWLTNSFCMACPQGIEPLRTPQQL